MAILLPFAKQQFADANGATLSLGTVTLYVPGTSTLKDSWQDAGQTALNTNPIALDIGGYATIYGNGSYRQLVKDRLGNIIWDRVVSSAPGDGVVVLQSLANLTPVDGDACLHTEAGREGMFVFSSANLSAQVAADTQQGIYVAPASDTTGGSGAWVRKFTGPPSAKMFGAVGDGVTLDTTAIAAALANTSKGFVALPDGPYNFTATLPANLGIQSVTEGAAKDMFYWGRNYSGVKATGAGSANLGYGPAAFMFDVRADSADVGADFMRAFYGRTVFGGSAAKGGRLGLLGEVYHSLGATNAASANRNYVGVTGQANVDPPAATGPADGGTNTAAGSKGAYFGMNAVVRLGPGATNVFEATGCELNTYVKSTASTRYLLGATIAGFNEARGAELDGALEIGGGTDNGYGPHVGWKFGIVFSNIHGGSPTASDSILFGSYWNDATKRTILHGIDLSGFTMTGVVIQGAAMAMTENSLTLGVNVSNISTITAGNGATNASLALVAKGTGGTNLVDGSSITRLIVDNGVGIRLVPKASAIPVANGELAVEATSNTSLTFRFKGSDGVVRINALTLA